MTRDAANDLGRGYSARRVTAAILRDLPAGQGVPLGDELLAVIHYSKLDSVKRPWRCRDGRGPPVGQNEIQASQLPSPSQA